MDREVLRKIWNEAVGLKREGKFPQSISKYNEALELDPNEVLTYYGMAKVFFLMGDKTRALLHYLITCHYSLLNMSNNQPLLNMQLSQIDSNMKESFSKIHEIAPAILLDPNIPRHIGAALIFIDPDSNYSDEIIEYGVQYNLGMLGKESKSNDRIDDTILTPKGVVYLLENINWSEFYSNSPHRHYP